MEKIKLFENLEIHAYKHNKKIYKQWSRLKVLNNDPNFLILATESSSVVERWYKSWWTKEHLLVFFYKNHWFNIFATLKENGEVIYYCNISSPFLKYDDVVMYIDYDLDVKVFADGRSKVIDINEYINRKEYFKYPKRLQKIIEKELEILQDMIEKKEGPFDSNLVKYWLNYYYDHKEEPIRDDR